MRKLPLVFASIVLPSLADAAVISEFGGSRSYGDDYNGYEILYSFAPIASIPGTVTSVQLVFTGIVTPGLRDARGTVLTATITPMIQFSNNLPGGINTLTVPQVNYTGTPQTLAVEGYRTTGATTEYVSLTSTNTISDFPLDEFTTTSYQMLTFFSRISGSTGTGYFPNENEDNTSGGGSLELLITYNPVPEPPSMALLATAGLGMIVLQRRRLS